jgi:hypothetical protein
MTSDENGSPVVHLEHVVDAVIVAALAFFVVLAGDVVPAILAGEGARLTAQQIAARIPLAVAMFGLTFFAQWARARGIELKQVLTGGNNS